MLCGEEIAAADKNREHPLPKWLLERTGALDHPFTSHTDYSVDPPRYVQIAADRFKFPAHKSCNTEFGDKLEAPVLEIAERLWEEGKLSAWDVSRLMDWMDKIRVCMWWAVTAREGNTSGSADPQISAAARIALCDRALTIVRFDDEVTGVQIFGPFQRGFQRTPSAIGLMFKNVALLSVSDAWMLADTFGLPTFYGPERFLLAPPATGSFVGPPRRLPGPMLLQPISRIPATFVDDFRPWERLKWPNALGNNTEGAVFDASDIHTAMETGTVIAVPTTSGRNRERVKQLLFASFAESLLWLKDREELRDQISHTGKTGDRGWALGRWELTGLRDHMLATLPPWRDD